MRHSVILILPEIEFLIMNVVSLNTHFKELLFESLHHGKRTAHINMVIANISACILYNIVHCQRTICGRETDISLQARILLRGRFDLVRKDGIFRMTNCVVKIHIVFQVIVHIARESEKGRHANPTRDPDLLLSAHFIIEHPMCAFHNGFCSCFQIMEEMAGR